MEYHVLSNYDIGKILLYGLFSTGFIWALFGYLAHRDASTNQPPKGLFGKTAPWIVFCILLSDICLLIYKCIDYPWNIDPQPSKASAFREMNEMVSGYPVWGWANDYQLTLLSSLSWALLWFGWTIYAFDFRKSNTNWWRKTIKVIAYFLLSSFIVGFSFHQYRELLVFGVFLCVVALLLWVAHVRPEKKPQSQPESKEEQVSVDDEGVADEDALEKEDYSRFMPPLDNSKTEDVQIDVEVTEPYSNNAVVDTNNETPVVHQEKQGILIESAADKVKGIEEKKYEDTPENGCLSTEMMYCKHCGKRIEADSTFCKYCGKRL